MIGSLLKFTFNAAGSPATHQVVAEKFKDLDLVFRIRNNPFGRPEVFAPVIFIDLGYGANYAVFEQSLDILNRSQLFMRLGS